jgi:hypothetical protein
MASAVCAIGLRGGVIEAPALLASTSGIETSVRSYPPGSELVELPIEEDVALRGAFVPSDPGAPVVLHFVESSGTVGVCSAQWWGENASVTAQPRARSVYFQLRHLGFASLAVDYEGVGRSDGERSVRKLKRDAMAAWDEAVRRAGGRPDRVILRGTSIGTLAVSHLLEAGCRPAGVVLTAPVLSDTVIWHFGVATRGRLFTTVATLLLEDLGVPPVDESLASHPVPTYAWLIRGDELLADADVTRLQRGVASCGGVVRQDENPRGEDGMLFFATPSLNHHVQGALMSRTVVPGEAAFLAELFPDAPLAAARVAAGRAGLPADLAARLPPDSEAGRRLDRLLGRRLGDDPVLAAWVALSIPDEVEALGLLNVVTELPEAWRRSGGEQALATRLDTGDPDGPLPLAPLVRLGVQLAVHDRASAPHTVDQLLDMALGVGVPHWDPPVKHGLNTFASGTLIPSPFNVRDDLWDVVSEPEGVDDLVAARRLLRVMFRAAGIEEQLVRQADGSHRLEVCDGGAWRVLDPAWVITPRNTPYMWPERVPRDAP